MQSNMLDDLSLSDPAKSAGVKGGENTIEITIAHNLCLTC